MTITSGPKTDQDLAQILRENSMPTIEEIEQSLEDGKTLPSQMYHLPEIAALEEQLIFGKTWQYACHESKVEKPGDYAVAKAGKTPIIIVRQRDGSLRGFVNACRHRLHSLAVEDGSAKLLQCPYHGWTYGLDGDLRNAPRAEREPGGFDCSKISLIPVSVEQWHQWIYVNPDPEAAPLSELVAPVEKMASEMNADLKTFTYRTRLEYKMECNWKLWAENAVECYHCPTMHARSFGQAYDTSPDAYAIGAEGMNIWNHGPLEWLPDGLSKENSKGFRFLFTFPSSFFALDDYVGFVGAVYPTSPTTCYAFVDLYEKPGADPEIFKAYEKMWDETLMEDKAATDLQQAGYSSDQIESGNLMLDSEVTLQAFMKNVLSALKGNGS